METIERQTTAAYSCLVTGQSPFCLWNRSTAAAAVADCGAI